MRYLAILIFWIPLGACSYLSLTLLPEILIDEDFNDKALHTLAYIYLGSTLWFSHYFQSSFVRPAIYLSLYGIGIEILQGFLPYRSFSFKDMLANTVGLLIAGILCILSAHFLQIRQNKAKA